MAVAGLRITGDCCGQVGVPDLDINGVCLLRALGNVYILSISQRFFVKVSYQNNILTKLPSSTVTSC